MEIYLKHGAFERILVGSKTIELRKYINIFKNIQVSDRVYFKNKKFKLLLLIYYIKVYDLLNLLSLIYIKKTVFVKRRLYRMFKKCYSNTW